MAIENSLRFIRVDYQSHKDALLQRIRARYPRAWNDFLTGSFGIVLVDIVAWSMATMAFLINRAAGETHINTMTLRESAVNIGSLTGYQLRSPVAATVMCEASITTPQSTPVLISKGTIIRSSSNAALPFEVERDYTIEIGYTTPRTIIVQISASGAGQNVLASSVVLTPGSTNIDLTDTTIDLKDYVQAGQIFKADGLDPVYVIQDIQASPGAVSNNRLVVDTPYLGLTATTVAGEVYDNRITCVQGLTIQDEFVSPADTSPSFVLKLGTTPVVSGSVSVLVNGSAWNQVANFSKSAGDAQDYQFKVTASGQPLVLFGDGKFGATIPTEATISVSYRVGGGSSGNIDLNSINSTITGLLASTNNPITIQITNGTSPGLGGRDAETLEEARVNIPASTRANDRAVTLDDYQTIATAYPGIVYARAMTRPENALLEGNIVFIYAWTSGASGGLLNLTPGMKSDLEAYVQSKAIGTDLVRISDGTARPIPASIRFKAYQGFNINDTGSLVQDALNGFISVLRPGQPVLYSNLVRVLDEVKGVDTINMATPTGDLYPSNSLELFTKSSGTYSYPLSKNGVTSVYSTLDTSQVGRYVAQLPVYPVQAWSIRLFLGSNELSVQPGILPGYAQVFGVGLSIDPDKPSTVNLLTGGVSLWIKGSPGDLSMRLVTLTGYSAEKFVNIYVGYTGDTSQVKRREIRAAIRAYSDGLSVGSPLYGVVIAGIIGSKSNITEVISVVSGVVSVDRVSLDTPGSVDKMTSVADTGLIRVADVILNSEID